MKKKVVLLMMATMISAVLFGCGAQIEESESKNNHEISEASEKENDDDKEDEKDKEKDAKETKTSEDKDADEDAEDNDNSFSTNSSIVYDGEKITFKNMSFIIPDGWEDRYIISENEDYITVYQKASYEKEEGLGILFSLSKYDGASYYANNGWQVGFDDKSLYTITFPSDVNFYYEDEEISNDYMAMSEDLSLVEASIEIDGKNVHRNIKEYKVPMSSAYEFSDEDYFDFDYRDMVIAYNEILAKAGYDFEANGDDPYWNFYFEGMTWYKPDSSVTKDDLTDIEKHNLEFLENMMAEREKQILVPIVLNEDSKVDADLDGDGKAEEIIFSNNIGAHPDSYLDFSPLLTINGKEFDLYESSEDNDFYFNYVLERAYVTDITPFFDGKEIAVLDYGASDDPMTYFYGYKDEELFFIGMVQGFIPDQETKLRLLSDFGGGFTGPKRSDLMGTSTVYTNYWYNYDEQCIEENEYRFYDYVISTKHKLLTDLTVYPVLGCDSYTRQIKAGEEVYFVATDEEQWLEIKDANGIKAYVFIADNDYPTKIKNGEVDMEVFDVFDNIIYAD